MAERLLLDVADGITEYLVCNDDDTFTVERVADIEDTIEDNKRLFTENDGYSPSREWKRVASFPVAMIPYFEKLFGANPFAPGHEDLLERICNDPDLRYFRTAPGR